MLDIAAILLTAALMQSVASSPLDAVKAEPNLEKRSEKALDYADDTMDKIRGLYKHGDWKGVQGALSEIGTAVDLARESLVQSGKNPRKSPKYFKKAELKSRELARRLTSFSQEVSFEERSTVDSTREHVMKVHDQFLEDVMTRRK